MCVKPPSLPWPCFGAYAAMADLNLATSSRRAADGSHAAPGMLVRQNGLGPVPRPYAPRGCSPRSGTAGHGSPTPHHWPDWPGSPRPVRPVRQAHIHRVPVGGQPPAARRRLRLRRRLPARQPLGRSHLRRCPRPRQRPPARRTHPGPRLELRDLALLAGRHRLRPGQALRPPAHHLNSKTPDQHNQDPAGRTGRALIRGPRWTQGNWQLPGPDFHRQATTSLRTRRNTNGITSRCHLLSCWAHEKRSM